MRQWSSLLAALAVTVFTLGALAFAAGPGGADGPVKSPRDVLAQKGDGDGLQFAVGGDAAAPAPAARATATPAARLGAAATARLVARMPALEGETGDVAEFRLRKGSPPPPRTGETVAKPFPPTPAASGPDRPAAGALEVLRFAPEGDVDLAPHLSVTFSQPMVAVTSHEDTLAAGVPVKLTPEPAGAWRWVGSQTLLFEPEPRFPMATEYQVEIPAGTRSATGGELKKAVRFTFATPAPRMTSSSPSGGPHGREPLLWVGFDQAVEAEQVLRKLSLSAGRGTFGLRLATAEETAGDRHASRVLAGDQRDRWVFFRARKPLPVDTEVTVTVGKGTPSAEGPRVTASAQRYTFRTFGKFRVDEHKCSSWKTCRPYATWYVHMTNPIDVDHFEDRGGAELVKVTPAVPGMEIWASGRTVTLRGPTKGRTSYSVTLSKDLRDTFGQTLGRTESVGFEVGGAQPSLFVTGGTLATLDPEGPATYSVYTVNHPTIAVDAYAVGPEDWGAFAEYMQRHPDADDAKLPPGRRVFSDVFQTKGEPDTLTETAIDLAPALKDGVGHVVLVISPPHGLLKRLVGSSRRTYRRVWVQRTRIGLDAFVDDGEVVGWANDLTTGAPLEGVSLELRPGDRTTRTGPGGIGRIALPERRADQRQLLVARKGADSAFVPQTTSFWGAGAGWRLEKPAERLRWYVIDDRKMYRPGEEVSFKGWIRRWSDGEGGDVSALGTGLGTLQWKAFGARGNEIGKGQVDVGPFGGFHLTLPLPGDANLGGARIEFKAPRSGDLKNLRHSHYFQVQEFRRPEFEVTASASAGPHIVGRTAVVTAVAKYYAGGGLANADVQWTLTTRQGSFTPPGRSGWVFGTWTPWWRRGGHHRASGAHRSESGITDGDGRHELTVSLDGIDPPRAMVLSASAAVRDVNRQRWTASTDLVVHPSSLYVGLKTPRGFVHKGQPILVDAIVVNLDGELISGRAIALEAVRTSWVRRKGRWVEEDSDPMPCDVTSGAEPARCEFAAEVGGRYRIRAAVVDDEGRGNRSELTVWVSGAERPPARKIEKEKITLIPDRERYQPGDTAELLVQAPFWPAEGLVTTRRSGILTTERFRMEEASHILRIPVQEAHIPNVHVQVDLVGAAPRVDARGVAVKGAPARPAYASGHLNLPVPPLKRTLSVSAEPLHPRVEPGAETSVAVAVKGADGAPLADAEVAVVVVDEAVLALSSYRLTDPIDIFYPRRSSGGTDHHSRATVLLANPESLAEQMEHSDRDSRPRRSKMRMLKSSGAPPPSPMAAAPEPEAAEEAMDDAAPGGGGGDSTPIAVRADFRALALFAPAVRTDADGRARVDVKLPDNLTRYRVMAVAVDRGTRFGSTESAITARLPLMVRPSPPRFLNFGDTFELPVVVQNQTDAPLPVEVAVRALNAELTDGAGRRVTVPPNDRVEIRFPAAAKMPGTARFQVAATALKWADAASFELPVWTPATTEAFATYGVLDEGLAIQPVSAPSDVVKAFGGLEVTTSSTALQSLTDAFLYLIRYPFECAEQVSSRLVAVAALRDVLSAFEADGLPSPKELERSMNADIERLRGMQNNDGGYGFWRRGNPSWPFVSVHVAHALARARAKGYTVPKQTIRRSMRYLQRIERHIPRRYSEESRRFLRAYALHVLELMGNPDAKKAKALVAEVGPRKLEVEVAGFLLPTLKGTAEATALLRALANRVTESAAGAHFVTRYSDGAHVLLHSDRRADGVALEALVRVDPSNDLIPKLVRGLLAHRKRGRWSNTQENAFVLLALDRYFGAFEKETPNFVARAWLGDGFVGEHRFRGRTTERHRVDVPMAFLAQKDGAQDLVLQKDGPGRMYYRVGMRYAPADLKLDPADHGFTVQRTYEAIDDPKDVTRAKDGTWEIRAGARVRVRLSMVATMRRYHVALVDPLPAGLEPQNPALAVTGPLPEDPKASARKSRFWWWYRTWYEHQNLRDERVEAFTSLLWAGVHEYTYVALATTPGAFVAPPPRAEEMYHPETFGRGATDKVVVR